MAVQTPDRPRECLETRARVASRRSPYALPALTALVMVLAALAAVVVASLALADVAAGWAVLFFYMLPALMFVGWSVRELEPSLWRRAVHPFLWLWTCATGRAAERPQPARHAPRPAEPDEEERQEEAREEAVVRHRGALLASERLATFEERTIQPWLLVMRMVLSVRRSPRARRLFNVVFAVAALALTVLAGEHFARVGWPLRHANPGLVAAAGALLVSTFAFKAFGWQRLFRHHERPTSLSLVAAAGLASLAGIALPGRFDDAVRISIVRRFPRVRVGIGTVALSLFLLGLLDTAAMTPFAAVAAISGETRASVRVAFAVVTVAGLGAGALAAALPRISASARLGRYRVARWLSKHAPASSREALFAALLVLGSWVSRMTALVLLLSAFGFGKSLPLAAAYMAGGAASAALPISPAGAATQTGVGAVVLAAAGISPAEAIAFSIAAQLLTILAGTLMSAFALTLHGARRLRRA